MAKIGIIICGRYQTCGGGKCLRALKEHAGGFAKYPKEEELDKKFIESHYKTPVVIGTHPIPLKYYNTHMNLPFWNTMNMEKIAGYLLKENKEIMASYD